MLLVDLRELLNHKFIGCLPKGQGTWPTHTVNLKNNSIFAQNSRFWATFYRVAPSDHVAPLVKIFTTCL